MPSKNISKLLDRGVLLFLIAYLTSECHTKRWASNFIKRQPELKARRFRTYDYKRAKCEGPEVIRGWPTLVRNIITKYGIVELDIYNFDETGFIMGIISTGMVITSAERHSNAKLAQTGNRVWNTVI
ncbi:transposase [Fusarium oxysporum f. sp. phaseoli]